MLAVVSSDPWISLKQEASLLKRGEPVGRLKDRLLDYGFGQGSLVWSSGI
jgi:hypothetical protein